MNVSCLAKVTIMILCCCTGFSVAAQKKDSADNKQGYSHQRDLVDYVYLFLHKNPDSRLDSQTNKRIHARLAVAPIVEYTTATGMTAGLAAGITFVTADPRSTNTSTIIGAAKITGKQQFLLPVQSSVWTSNNTYNWIGDWRYLDYPQDSYGFGGHTTLADKYIIGFKQFRFYELLLRRLKKYWYAGLGYQFDHHLAITESEVQAGRVTDFQRYGFTNVSTSSGLSLNLVYDSRKNLINPEPGSMYAGIKFLSNKKLLGADGNWSTLTIDARKYIALPFHAVIGFWMYTVFCVSGKPPYLDLPATGSDTYGNTGRGYELNRFTGKHMLDLETELRFPISRNGLIGGVLFANIQSFSELTTNRFEVFSPGVGFGLRIKLNKFSGTNICVDYGVGTKGSHGFSGNLGEVF